MSGTKHRPTTSTSNNMTSISTSTPLSASAPTPQPIPPRRRKLKSPPSIITSAYLKLSTITISTIIIIIIMALYLLHKHIYFQTYSHLLLAFFVIVLPMLTMVREAVRSSNTRRSRFVTASFVLSIVAGQIPRVWSAFLVAVLLCLLGLSTRPAPHLQQLTKAACKENDSDVDDDVNDSKHDADLNSANDHNYNYDENDDDDDDDDIDDGTQTIPLIQILQKIPIKTRGIVATILLIIVMMTENFFIWVVSSTYEPSHEPPYPEPLQDNGRILLQTLLTYTSISNSTVQSCRNLLQIQWSLVAAAGTALALADLNMAPRRNVYTLGTRVVITLASARLTRLVCFTLTVLPSQTPWCYHQRFPLPTPPFLSKEWFLEGATPRSKGGCNDLVLSGHATVTSALGCIATDVAGNPAFASSLWLLVLLDYAVEVYQGYHYSIDMVLGMLITRLLYHVYAPLGILSAKDEDEPRPRRLQRRRQKQRQRLVQQRSTRTSPFSSSTTTTKTDAMETFIPLSTASTKDVIQYAIPPLLAFWSIVAPPVNPNVFLAGFGIFAGISQWNGDVTYGKHLCLCTLYAALSIYL